MEKPYQTQIIIEFRVFSGVCWESVTQKCEHVYIILTARIVIAGKMSLMV